MCGIAGVAGRLVNDNASTLVTAMTDRIAHRGPDGSGFWMSGIGGVALGQRRLAVIDLSELGRQPMLLDDGRYAVVFNGEVYNYLQLRRELEERGERFRSQSDTEVLLRACATFGVIDALTRVNAMLAMALWDSQEKLLWLAVDRFGEKPLYWTLGNGSLTFGSELKALRAVPQFDATIDLDALARYTKFGGVPAPATIYKGCRKLRPGSALCFKVDTASGDVSLVREVTYFDAVEEAAGARTRPFTGSFADAADTVEQALTESIRIRMLSDVPLGAFLSGGIDSSLTVALMAKISPRPINTFTIGFEDDHVNEATFAEKVADHLGTAHTAVTLTAAEMLDVVPKLATMYDEPFADSSQVPTHLLSKITRRQVTVALSGDAGDELFSGYNRYLFANSMWNRLARVPIGVRSPVSRAIKRIPPATWDLLGRPVSSFVRKNMASGTIGGRAHQLAELLPSASGFDLYDRLVSIWDEPVVLGVNPTAIDLSGGLSLPEGFSLQEQMMLSDTLGYLPTDILTKVDRASMSVSLETRVPMLDPNVFRLAWQLPMSQKVGRGGGKLVLREILAKHVPVELFERPKMGFGIPLAQWLRGDLREWAEDLLSERSLADSGFFDVKLVRTRWTEHLSGKRNREDSLWTILMFQSWLREWAV